MYEFCLLILFSEFLQIPEDAACAVVALSWARTWRRKTRYANFYCWAFSPLSHLTVYRGLRAVNLTCCEHLRVVGLRHLPRELQVLDLTLCHPVDLAPVARFTQLRELKLRYWAPSLFVFFSNDCLLKKKNNFFFVLTPSSERTSHNTKTCRLGHTKHLG